MKHFGLRLVSLVASISNGLACGDYSGVNNYVEHVRHVRRMQPEASNATSGPTRALEWGQVNFLHTVSLIQDRKMACAG
jgi:hypothetical protein